MAEYNIAVVQELAKNNYRLIGYFISRNLSRLPKGVNARSSLTVPYMEAIIRYVTKDAAKYSKVSTYIMNALRWHIQRLWQEGHIIKNQLGIPNSHSERARAIIHFHGREGRCHTKRLLVYDDDRLSKRDGIAIATYLLSRINNRQRGIIIHRYFHQCTLEETARAFGISTERTRQIEARAISALRNIVDNERITAP